MSQMASRSNAVSTQDLERLRHPVLDGAVEQLIETELGTINVTVGGEEDGPAFVFWPSLMMQGSMWSYQYEHYRSTHRVVLIDSPGIGKSEALRKYIDLKDCKDCLVEILDALGIERCLFAGNSWGAMLAAVLPAWIPDRLLGTVVVNGTASLPTRPETITMTLRAEALMMYATVPDWWVATARAAFAGDTATATNPEFVDYLGVVAQEDPKSIAWSLRGILLGRKDYHGLLRTTGKVPVLVIAGEEDRQFPVYIVRKLADAIPGSTFVVLPHTGHLAARERPDEVNGVIDRFLETNTAAN